MAHTNSTENYGLPQWIGTDKPTFLGDFNSAFGTIDTQMKSNADAASNAVSTANSASAVATSANTNATTALNTANSAASDAASAVTTAGTANTTATTANTNASAALRASAANTIENLAPAYDSTLTYQVGDLVTYIDAQNSGKLYKCIVAVNTPMDFNINYWDDVTTSEVYTRPSNVVSEVTADGVLTNGDIFNSLMSGVSVDYESEYLLKRITSANNIAYYHEVVANDGMLVFTFAGVSSDVHNYELHLHASNSVYLVGTITNGELTITDRTEEVVTSGIKYELIKLSTV